MLRHCTPIPAITTTTNPRNVHRAPPPQTHAQNNSHACAWSAPSSFTPQAETTSHCHHARCYTCLPASSTPDRSMVMNSGATFSTIRPHDQASERYVVVTRDDHRARKPEELGALVEAKRAVCTAGGRCDTWVRIRRGQYSPGGPPSGKIASH